MKKLNSVQQGDVLLKRVKSLPTENIKVISKRKLRLAEGEVTGHFHGIESETGTLYDCEGTMFLSLEESATLTHQEHGNIDLDAGIWKVGQVNEYDYFAQMKRKVVD